MVGPGRRLVDGVSPPAELFGRVVDSTGAPVPHARIVIVSGSMPMPEIALVADGEGRFSLRLPPGVFTLRAHGRTGTGDVTVQAPRDDEAVLTVCE